MKLTMKKLNKLIREELNRIDEVEEGGSSSDPVAYLDQKIKGNAFKGYENEDKTSKQLDELKQLLGAAKESVDNMKTVSFEVNPEHREQAYKNMIKIVDIAVDRAGPNQAPDLSYPIKFAKKFLSKEGLTTTFVKKYLKDRSIEIKE